MTGAVKELVVEGYRSIPHLTVRFNDVNLITGPNGCGKSNLFNAFRLIKSAMQGQLAKAISEQGGTQPIIWAGARGDKPIRVKLGVVADPFEYQIEFGLRPLSEFPLFPHDPQIKSEIVKLGGRTMIERKSVLANVRTLVGGMKMVTDLVDSETLFAQIFDPENFAYLYHLRDLVGKWTFYHEFRTDVDSPIRRPAIPTFAPRLHEDGSNLGPTLFVIHKHGDVDTLDQILKRAFPNARFLPTQEGVHLEQDGIPRTFEMRDFSDGTLKFLCIAAACFSYKPAPFLAFNEPETSISASAIQPLADLFAHAAQFSQLWITTHSEALATALVDRLACHPIRLDKVSGATVCRHENWPWISCR